VTSYLNDTTIWKSYFMIKYMWNFILMKYIIDGWFDLYTIRIMFRLMKWLKLCAMESTPNCWEYMDDFNKGKRIVLKLLSITSMCSIYTSSGYHYFVFFIRNLKLIFVFTGFWIHLMCSKDFGNKERIIIEFLWFWSKRQDYKLWFWYKNL
jgi:hypothetical protein